jgi:hypothetical protein
VTTKNGKLRHLKDAPRLMPRVSSTKSERRKYLSPKARATRKDGIAQRTAMRRLLARKLALIDPSMIDQNSPAWRAYHAVVKGVTNDKGGISRLSTVETVLVNAFAAAAVRLNDLTARQLLGDNSKLQSEGFSQTVAALARLASQLGISRRAKDVVSLSSYLKKPNGDDTIEGEIINGD